MIHLFREETIGSPSAFRLFAGPVPGMLACIAVSLVAVRLGKLAPVVGAPVFGIMLGILAGNLFGVPASFRPGVAFCGKKVLQFAIIVLGGSLSLGQVWQTGRESLGVMLVTLAVALIGARMIGRGLKVGRNLTSLVGVGTGICGGSAIAAVAPVIDARDEEIAFSISTVFLFNVVAVLVFPALGRLLHLSDAGFGLWAGTAINDTSSVVAAAYSYSREAGDYATVVKLARTMMIIPISLGFALLVSRGTGGGTFSLKRVLPWFILGFLFLSLLNTAGALGTVLPDVCGKAGKYLIVVALAGVGFGASLGNMVKTGPRPILLGLLIWILVSLTSLGAQMFLRQW